MKRRNRDTAGTGGGDSDRRCLLHGRDIGCEFLQVQEQNRSMKVSDARRLKAHEEENAKLKKPLANQCRTTRS